MRATTRRMTGLALGLTICAAPGGLWAASTTAPAHTHTSAATQPAQHAANRHAAADHTAATRLASTRGSHATTALASTRAAAAPTSAPTSEPAQAKIPSTPNDALAERLSAEASQILRTHTATPALWHYAEAMLQSATRLAPDEPRFARLLVEAAMRGDDPKGAIAALDAYRKLDPRDEKAQVELIDLYLSRMESSDHKVAYLKAIVAAEGVSPGVRSMAAMRLCRVYAERMENQESADALEQALKLNPLNIQAQRLRFQWLPPASPAERCRAELTMLLASPAESETMARLARELGAAGLVGRSIEWFNQAIDLHRRLGYPPPADITTDYAAEMLINGDARAAERVATNLTNQKSDDLNAWLMRLIATRATGDQAALNDAIKLAHVALFNRLAEIARKAGDTSATTRPIDTREDLDLPDPRVLLERIQASKKPELLKEFMPVAGGVAWMRIYFERKPGSAVPWVQTLASIAKGPDAEETVARLQGWEYLVAGNNEDAKVKLQAVADRDPVAALGLIELNSDKAKADESARKLLEANASGLTGAQICEALKDRKIKVTPGPAAAEINKVLSDFPRDYLKIIDKPDKFYSLRLDPVRVAVQLGEPVLVQVTVTNISNFPLTVGPEGVLHPDLWLDAQLRGVHARTFPAEAYQRLGGPFVLMPGGAITQIVRLDQNQLAAMLQAYPRSSFQISGSVMTNPMTLKGQIGIGPCGTRSPLIGLIERHGEAIGSDQVRQDLSQAMDTGSPEEKVRAIDVLSRFAALLSQQTGNDPAKQISAQSVDMVRNAMSDDDPTVRAFATYRFAMLTHDAQLAGSMLEDPFWLTRVYGILLTDELGLDRAPVKPLAKDDADPVVKLLAGASLAARLTPATQPSSQPAATQPAEQ